LEVNMVNSRFKITGPLDYAQDRDVYVERPELDDIYREIRRPYVENYVALLGSRQTGKTTLLYRIYRELKREGDPVAFLDLSSYRVESMSQSYAHAALKIWEELRDMLTAPGKLRALATVVNGPIRFREFMLELARQCSGTRIVILLDEVGSFVSNMGFFETLRSISSSGVHDSEQAFKKYLFVFAGSVDLHDLTTGQNSPLANVCKPIYLSDFDLTGTQSLVNNLNQVASLEFNVAPYIHHHARGHPYLTQRICALIEESLPRRSKGRKARRKITTRAVDRAIDRMHEGDENLRYVTLQLGSYPQARDLLRRMITEGLIVPFSIIDPRVARLFVIGVVRRDIATEVVRGIVRERSRCTVRNPIYEDALRQYFETLPLPQLAESWETHAYVGEAATEEIKVERSPAEPGRAVSRSPLPPVTVPRDYLDFSLHIYPSPTRGDPFPITVDSWSGTGNGQMVLDPRSLALQAIVQRLERDQIGREDLFNLGAMLWQAIFASPEIGRRYVACQAEAGTQKGIRLKLNIESPDLMGLPWEYLYDPESQTFPGLSPRTPITRYTNPGQQEPPPLTFDPPLRILLVSASPTGHDQLDVEAERTQIIQAMARLQQTGKAVVETLARATVRRLQMMLRRPFHVLHYIGHGVYDEETGSGMLALEDESGEQHAISAAQLQYLLRDTTVRLAVLNACMTAHGAAGRGIAGELMRAGLSATLAMQFAIEETSATTFAGEFYRTLADGWPVDAAVAEGRKAVMFATDLHQMDWGIPALFMRTRDGVLFRRQAYRGGIIRRTDDEQDEADRSGNERGGRSGAEPVHPSGDENGDQPGIGGDGS
jgi:hypothetical protein